jgi:hypothetical protein
VRARRLNKNAISETRARHPLALVHVDDQYLHARAREFTSRARTLPLTQRHMMQKRIVAASIGIARSCVRSDGALRISLSLRLQATHQNRPLFNYFDGCAHFSFVGF